MRVWVEGQGTTNLPRKSYVGMGGQASVYAVSGVAYKIYNDPAAMFSKQKIQELRAISDPRIVKPESLIYQSKRGPVIGYTMRHVRDAFVLCQLFSRAFRDRVGVDDATILHLVSELRAGIESVHQAGVLLVDGNELNFLVSSDLKSLFFVDVDSYQTPSHPATAIMDSIRDRHSATFSKESDWFSFAVVAFQLFVGIHPYKGKHPQHRGLEARMLANISVFDSMVRVPTVVSSPDLIPPGYREWFRRVFQDGLRTPPPTQTHKVTPMHIAHQPVLSGARLHFHKLRPAVQPGRLHIALEAGQVVLLEEGTGQRASLALDGQDAITLQDGRVYLQHGASVSEVETIGAGNTLQISLRLAARVLPHATQLWPGFVKQDLLGSVYVNLLPNSGLSYQLTLPELNNTTIVDAKFEGTVLVASAYVGAQINRYVFRFDKKFSSYDCRIVEDVPMPTVNFTVLSSGVCLCLNEEAELEVFHAKPGLAKLDVIADTSLSGDMRLYSQGSQALVDKQGVQYRISMV